jgi:hypothetical protein
VRIAEPLFPNDDGLADPSLQAALAGDDRYEIVAALAQSRVFVALLAELESGDTSEMSLTWLVDGEVRALPIFSSIAAISAWNLAARPLGVEARRAAVVALTDGAIAVLDPGSATSHEIGTSALRSLALGYEYLPLSIDPIVGEVIAEALLAIAHEDHEIAVSLTPAEYTADLVITLVGSPVTLNATQISAFAVRLADDMRLRMRLELGVDIKFIGATA